MFDVRVVAFAGGSARTLQALQELFGLDREAAQRLVDNVPLVVRRAAPANEAQNYVDALRGIGAEVALERPDAAAEPAPAKKPPPPG
ncbi:MAG TPA: ribosomal protein L7/L12, partial [Polyangiales bacterium]|nr:ribosomal protein L7/L12 [Polyangiales bacterium]